MQQLNEEIERLNSQLKDQDKNYQKQVKSNLTTIDELKTQIEQIGQERILF